MVIAIRHGETVSSDASGRQSGGGDAELLRGNLDVPLNAAGQQHVLQSAQEIADHYPIHEVRSSPNYLRATQTRHIVAQVCGCPEVDAPEFVPWDAGQLTGQTPSIIGTLLMLLIDVPIISAPSGQSLSDYYQQFSDAWHGVYAEYGGDDTKAVVVVLFGNELRVLPAILSGQPIDNAAPQKVKPGDYVVVH